MHLPLLFYVIVNKNKTSTVYQTSYLKDAQVFVQAKYKDHTNTTVDSQKVPTDIKNRRK